MASGVKPMNLFDFYSLHLHLLTWFFCISFIAQTSDYKANIQMYTLINPLKGDTDLNLVNFSHILTMKNCKKSLNRSDDSLKALSIPVKC